MPRKGAMSPVERAQAQLEELEGQQQEGQEEAEGGQEEEGQQAQESSTADREAGEEPSKSQKADDDEGEDGEGEQPQRKQEPELTDAEIRHKYDTLQGMFRKLKEQNEGLIEQNRLLMDRVEQRTQQSTATESDDNVLSGDASKAELAAHVKQLEENYGSDFHDIMKSFMRYEFDKMFNEKIKPVNERVERSEQTAKETKQEAFNRELNAQVPDWPNIWNDNGFHVWLAQNTEEMSGMTYDALFKQANKNWDLTSMVRFFNKYKQATGQVATDQNKGQDTTASRQGDQREKLVTPSKTTGTTVKPEGGQKKIWSRAEMNAFYKSLQTGTFEGTQEEAARIDAEIFEANREGRIR